MKTSFNFIILCLVSYYAIIEALCNDPINCYLQNLVINIPDEDIPIDGSNLELRGAYCNNIGINSIPSAYVVPSSINIGIQDASTSCKANYRYKYLLTVFKGDVNIKITKTSASALINTTKNNDIYPKAFTVPQCSVSSINIDLTFTGGITNSLLNLLTSSLKNHIQDSVKKVICTQIVNLIITNGTYTLQTQINPYLYYIINTAPTPIPTFTNNMLNWRIIYTKYESFLKCIKSNHPIIAALIEIPAVNTIVNLFTHGTGILTLPLDLPPIFIDLNNRLIVHTLGIKGLDTFHNISLFEPSVYSDQAVTTKVGLSELVITINVTYTSLLPPSLLQLSKTQSQAYTYPPTTHTLPTSLVNSPQESYYTEDIQLQIIIHNSTLEVITLLAIDLDKIGGLSTEKITHPTCLLEVIDNLNVTSLTLYSIIENISIKQLGGSNGMLEVNLLALIDNVLELGVVGYSELVTGVLSGLFQGYVKGAVNEALSMLLLELVQHSPCPYTHVDPPLPTHSYIPDSYIQDPSSTTASTTTASAASTASDTDADAESEYITFSDSIVLEYARLVINTLLAPHLLNPILQCTIPPSGSLVILDSNDYTVEISGYNSITHLSLLNTYPSSLPFSRPFNLWNRLDIGQCDTDTCQPVIIAISTHMKNTPPAAPLPHTNAYTNTSTNNIHDILHNMIHDIDPSKLNLEITLANLNIYFDVFLQINAKLLSKLKLKEYFESGCLLSIIHTSLLHSLLVDINYVTIRVDGKDVYEISSYMNAAFHMLADPTVLQEVNKYITANILTSPHKSIRGVEASYMP